MISLYEVYVISARWNYETKAAQWVGFIELKAVVMV
jgi:hypothetical protein